MRAFRPLFLPLIPVLTALAVAGWDLDRVTLWRDEAATLSAVDRSVGDLWRMLGHIDAVHGAYYLFMNGWTAVFGTSVTAIRMPSVLAVAVAAGVTAVLGRRLADPWVGLWAGLLVAASPLLSRYGQEARQYTIVTAAAVVSTYVFVRAVENRTRPWPWFGYAVSLAVIGWLHLFGLLLLPVHALTLLALRPGRIPAIRWALAAAAGLAAAARIAQISQPQSGRQVEWIPAPSGEQIMTLLRSMAGGDWLIIPVIAVALLGLWRPYRRPDEVDLRVLGFAWTVVPIGLLLLVSLIEPYYVLRYVIFCYPGLALLVAAGLRRLPLWGALPGLAALLVATIPLHSEFRAPDNRSDDLRALADTIARNRQDGDAIIFREQVYRRVLAAYPEAYRGLRDPGMNRTAAAAGELYSTEITGREALLRRLAGVRRIWYIEASRPPTVVASPEDVLKEQLIQESRMFRRVARWPYKGGNIYLYVPKRI